MEFLLDGFADGLMRVLRADPHVMLAAWVTIKVGIWATILASLIGLPVGFLLAMGRFRGRGFAITLLQTSLGLPTVVIGLLAYGFLSRRGPLGFADLLFTPSAIVVGLSVASVDGRVRETALTLGASNGLVAWTVLREARFGMIAAVLAAFGRVSSEVGIAMMLGGNIEGYTRTLTTAIALESMKGEFGFGIALGVVLLAIIFVTNLLSRYIQRS